MAPPHLPVRILRPGGRLPVRAHPGDAGLDLIAAEHVSILAGGRQAVPTAIAVAIPPGYAGLVVPRSGLARRHGVTVANAPGLIDAGYRGELLVLLVNLGDAVHRVEPGDRIAQLVVVPVGLPEAVAVEELPPSDGRGEAGFGSTG
ncbi:MAG TPA: dUTP diphosphatase [Miltoncostaeaceae bacterium]|nr:dUTP diphosphatase [Miltoncostaeaceae bacterium]